MRTEIKVNGNLYRVTEAESGVINVCVYIAPCKVSGRWQASHWRHLWPNDRPGVAKVIRAYRALPQRWRGRAEA